MSPTIEEPLDKAGATVLQLLQARQMFIGDELRVSTLRMSWTESGQDAEAFALALSSLQRAGLIRTVHGTAGPAVQLTHQGFRASSKPTAAAPPAKPQQRAAASPPKPAPRKAAPVNPAPRPAPEFIAMPTESLTNDAHTATNTTAKINHSEPVPATTTAKQPQDLAHAQVFRTRDESLNDNVFKHCLLSLMQHYRVRANGHLSYACIMGHWSEMGLSKDDLVYTLDLLLKDGSIKTVSEPKELIILTAGGFNRCISAPQNLDDGMDRWRAKKRLRMTKQLGCLPAA